MLRKKKIAFYIESMVVGGAEKVLIDLVNNLDKDKFDITVIAIFKKSVYSDYEFQFEDGCLPHIHYRYLIDNTQTWKYQLFNRVYNRLPKSWLYRFLVKETFDVEVAFYEGMPTDFVAHAPSKSKKIAWLHTHQARLYASLSPEALLAQKDLYRQYHSIVGVSQDVCASFSEVFPEMQAVCLYNVIDDSLIITKSKEQAPLWNAIPSSNNWLTVGRLIPIKGYDRLLRVLGKLKREGLDFRLHMLGDGEQRTELERIIEEEALQHHVTLFGHISNPYPYIRQADLLIMSSLQEGLSTVVMEAIIIGTPVLATKCSGMKELIAAENGWVVDNSAAGIESGLRQWIKQPIKHTQTPSAFVLKEQIKNFVQFFSNV